MSNTIYTIEEFEELNLINFCLINSIHNYEKIIEKTTVVALKEDAQRQINKLRPIFNKTNNAINTYLKR